MREKIGLPLNRMLAFPDYDQGRTAVTVKRLLLDGSSTGNFSFYISF